MKPQPTKPSSPLIEERTPWWMNALVIAAMIISCLALVVFAGCGASEGKTVEGETVEGEAGGEAKAPEWETREQNAFSGITAKAGNLLEAGTATPIDVLIEHCGGDIKQIAFGSNEPWRAGDDDRMIVVCESNLSIDTSANE